MSVSESHKLRAKSLDVKLGGATDMIDKYLQEKANRSQLSEDTSGEQEQLGRIQREVLQLLQEPLDEPTQPTSGQYDEDYVEKMRNEAQLAVEQNWETYQQVQDLKQRIQGYRTDLMNMAISNWRV